MSDSGGGHDDILYIEACLVFLQRQVFLHLVLDAPSLNLHVLFIVLSRLQAS